jgi:hypothetical protein
MNRRNFCSLAAMAGVAAALPAKADDDLIEAPRGSFVVFSDDLAFDDPQPRQAVLYRPREYPKHRSLPLQGEPVEFQLTAEGIRFIAEVEGRDLPLPAGYPVHDMYTLRRIRRS